MSSLVVDTNIILFAAAQNNSLALQILTENQIFISVITEIELLGYNKLTEEEYNVLKEILSEFTIIPLTESIKEETIFLRRKYALKTPDAIIAATAKLLDYFLVTADRKLTKVEDIKLLDFEV